ncbi:hypothetical protein [Caulobacter vibrioides]|uniref:hypothetical protein n=1 Tax=Caulobacter vibrioides TaxID=155892 RepID=UPI000BB4E961|nr:hypothetical protein [Caulobacter vibrioides]ATC23931.1 hypothetical protein CA608_05005 [Caulobacter vibrioides]PLR15860.1 hypothetical protein CVUC_01780 [Caulobacter vibrioides]
MSIKLASAEISRFLASSDPEVLCIRGRWGVGKTFAWNHYLDIAAKMNAVSVARYSYVSLFGQNSLSDVRSAIVENTVPVGDKNGPNMDSLGKMAEQGARGLAKLAKLIPQAKDYAPLGERLMFAMLKEQIICIDDLERAGTGLSKIDVLGLISELKEQKRCKVVLLLNYEELGADQSSFDAQIEKVADTVISFDPTPEEAADVGVDPTTSFAGDLSKHCALLRITNIRVIKRIERHARRLEILIGDRDARVLKQAIHSMTLFAYAKYQPNIAPSLAFIRKYNQVEDIAGGEGPVSDPAWRGLLTDYEFGRVDEFDLPILDGVERGYFDEVVLREKGQAKEAQLQLEDQDSSFSQAWRRYHDSFDDDAEAVLDETYAAFKSSIAAISPLNVDGTARLFKDLGRPEQSRELVEYYVANRNERRDFWNIQEYPFGGDLRDPDVLALFAQRYAAMGPEQYDAGELLVQISRNRGWSESYVAYLATLSADDYYNLFKALRGDDLDRATREALRFRHRGPVGSPEQTIGIRADEALERIAAESAINARRVQHRRSQA